MALPFSRRSFLFFSTFALGHSALAEGTPAQKTIESTPSPLGDRMMGNPAASVTMIEYASATCPHCAAFHVNILPSVKREYIDTGKVKFIFREFPLDSLALGVSMLTRCLPEAKFFDVTEEFFRTQETWARAQNPEVEITKITTKAGMDKSTFDTCISNQEMAKNMVEYSRKSGQDFGIKGTPAVFLNGVAMDDVRELAKVRSAIDAALNSSSAN